jgi:hypothetical protein
VVAGRLAETLAAVAAAVDQLTSTSPSIPCLQTSASCLATARRPALEAAVGVLAVTTSALLVAMEETRSAWLGLAGGVDAPTRPWQLAQVRGSTRLLMLNRQHT